MKANESTIPRVVLLRIGMDSGVGGIQGPLLKNRAFDYLPIPDDWNPNNQTRYGNTRGSSGRFLHEYWPQSKREYYRTKPIHFDPEFKTFTYGDPTRPKQSLRRLRPGDLLVFYAGLQPWSKTDGFYGEPHLYIIGYFTVELAGHFKDLLVARGRRAIEPAFKNCIHVVKGMKPPRKLVLIKGSKSGSKFLRKAFLISRYSKDVNGRRIKVLRKDLEKYFGRLSKRNYLQRSPPRWVKDHYSKRAYKFVRRLK